VHGDVASGRGGGGGLLERQAVVLAGEAIGDVHVAVAAELDEQRAEAEQVGLPAGGALGVDHHAVAAAQEPRHGGSAMSSRSHRGRTTRPARMCQRAACGWSGRSRAPSTSTTSVVPVPASRTTGGAHLWTTAGELRAARGGRAGLVVQVQGGGEELVSRRR
jgi:hypothetical protein